MFRKMPALAKAGMESGFPPENAICKKAIAASLERDVSL
jgi:hypothetical protein